MNDQSIKPKSVPTAAHRANAKAIVDEMRRQNADAIAAMQLARDPNHPRHRVTTLADWQDRLLGRNGKLSVADIESIYHAPPRPATRAGRPVR